MSFKSLWRMKALQSQSEITLSEGKIVNGWFCTELFTRRDGLYHIAAWVIRTNDLVEILWCNATGKTAYNKWLSKRCPAEEATCLPYDLNVINCKACKFLHDMQVKKGALNWDEAYRMLRPSGYK